MKELSTEKLLELVKEQPADEKPANDVEVWVALNGIKAGDARIENMILYHAYTQWAKDPLCKDQFTKHFTKLFKQHRNGIIRFYWLDPAPFDLSQDTYFRLRKQMRKQKAKYKRLNAKKEKAAEEKIRPESTQQPDPKTRSD